MTRDFLILIILGLIILVVGIEARIYFFSAIGDEIFHFYQNLIPVGLIMILLGVLLGIFRTLREEDK